MCERGQLDNRSKRDLRAAGVVVVEVDDPSKCQFIKANETINGDDMLWACLDALKTQGQYGSKGDVQRERLAFNLFRIVEEQREREGKLIRPKKPVGE